MAAVRHDGFSKTWFLSIGPLGLPIFHLRTKFGAKCWSTPKLWPKIEIQDGAYARNDIDVNSTINSTII